VAVRRHRRSSFVRMPTCKKNMLVKQKKLQKINLPGPQDADTSRALAAVAAASMC